MSITDELRHNIEGTEQLYGCECKHLLAIADRIDAAVDGMIELPKDADGEPIRIGDVMENIVCPSVHREVTGVGVECFYGWDEGNGRYSQFSANCYRHHQPDTWERIIGDACGGTASEQSLVARCKALAGDAE